MDTSNNNQDKTILQKIADLEEKKHYTISYNHTDKSKIESLEERIKSFGFTYQNGAWRTNYLNNNLDLKGLVGQLKRIKKFILAKKGIIKITMKPLLDEEKIIII